MGRPGLRRTVLRGRGRIVVLAALVSGGLIGVIQPSMAGAASLTYDTLDSVSCTAASLCQAVGWYDDSSFVSHMLAEEWNGTTWSVKATAAPKGNDGAALYGVSCVSASYCEAVGYYTKNVGGTDVQYPLAEAWNGTSWSLQTPQAWKNHYQPYLSSVSCSAIGSCEAAGDSTIITGGNVQVAFAEVLSGSAWARQSVSNSQNSVANGVSCVSSTSCEMIGTFNGRALAEAWNGSSWSTQRTSEPSGGNGVLGSVSCLPGAPSTCQAVGSASRPEGWNGTRWVIEAFDNLNGTAAMGAVSCASPSDCETVGSYSNTSNSPLTEVWNGRRWVLQSAPAPSGATATGMAGISCTTASNCEAIGDYTTSTNDQKNFAEIWNGTNWSLQTVPSV